MSFQIRIDYTKCTKCECAESYCPMEVLIFDKKIKLPIIDTRFDECIGCETCKIECPENAICITELDDEIVYGKKVWEQNKEE